MAIEENGGPDPAAGSFSMSARGEIRTLTTEVTRAWAVRGYRYTTRAESDRPDSNQPSDLGKIEC